MQTELAVDLLSMEDDQRSGSFPEHRVWYAIIIQAVSDYEETLNRIQGLRELRKRPIERMHLFHLRAIRRECLHAWFRHVCDMAGLRHSKVVTKLNALDEQYGLADTAFDGSDSVVTIYTLRRKRDKRFHG